MHELAITQQILDLAQAHCAAAGGSRVVALYLKLGQFSSMVDDSIQFFWDIISKETACEGATLHFERISAEIQCRDCGCRFGLDGGLAACPQCDGMSLQVLQGDECRLERIEISEAETVLQ